MHKLNPGDIYIYLTADGEIREKMVIVYSLDLSLRYNDNYTFIKNQPMLLLDDKIYLYFTHTNFNSFIKEFETYEEADLYIKKLTGDELHGNYVCSKPLMKIFAEGAARYTPFDFEKTKLSTTCQNES